MHDAGAILRHSYDKCCRVGVKPDLNIDQLENFEALTA